MQNHLSKEERKQFSLYFHELAADQGNVLSLLTIHAHYAGWISSSISSEKDDDLEERLMLTDEDGNVVVDHSNSDSNYEKAAQVTEEPLVYAAQLPCSISAECTKLDEASRKITT